MSLLSLHSSCNPSGTVQTALPQAASPHPSPSTLTSGWSSWPTDLASHFSAMISLRQWVSPVCMDGWSLPERASLCELICLIRVLSSLLLVWLPAQLSPVHLTLPSPPIPQVTCLAAMQWTTQTWNRKWYARFVHECTYCTMWALTISFYEFDIT